MSELCGMIKGNRPVVFEEITIAEPALTEWWFLSQGTFFSRMEGPVG